MLESHGGGDGGPGEGEYLQPVEEDHPDWDEGGSSLNSVMPLQSNLLGPPTQLLDSDVLQQLRSCLFVCLGCGQESAPLLIPPECLSTYRET